jgi:tripartite-type tricarboxylate transporter receptor subunit TctC
MRHWLALLGAWLACADAVNAQMQTWPQKPITFVVSNGAGSAPDVMARMLAAKLEPILGQSIVIETKPGGGNVIGALNVARAPADGYRLYFATSSALTANPFMMKNLPYDPLKDFDAVAFIVRANNFILAHKDVPVKTLAELIAHDKAKPGDYSIAIDGPRNLAGVTARALNHYAGMKLVHVAYPNIVNGLQDLVAGRLQVGVFPIAISDSFVKEGTLRPLARAGVEKISSYPDMPAVADLFPGFDFVGWFALMVPKGTPREIIVKLNEATAKAMRDPQIAATAPKLGMDFHPSGVGSPESATAFIEQQLRFWEKTTNELGIEPE